ncbi:probable cytochrome P450 CYP44 [Mizuhopecten yessoensis]|uniref:Cytochrome P450 CYP44 n=1 Tax=Mizuhopecten yessoensis TaxID=6573 RepID=A0A210Q4C3_MIZYE|nr:probable cytochrome P450 CYP44 [Mizuhopecten yessoensis]OWF43587.1 cytochrome P450 CYP44 [Mizuhopecten yessoensis]
MASLVVTSCGPRLHCLRNNALPFKQCRAWNRYTVFRSLSTMSVSYNEIENPVPNSVYDNAKPFDEIPGPRGLPFLGTLHQYRGPFQKFNIDRFQASLQDRYQKYGPIMKETIAGVTAVRLFDPDYVKIVYQNEGKVPHVAPLLDTTRLYRSQKNMSPGLGNTNGDEWYRLRSAVQQMMMRPKEVTVYLPNVQQVAEEFVNNISNSLRAKDGQVHNFRKELAKWNLESSGSTSFETRLGCLESGTGSWTEKMITANNDIFALSTKITFSVPFHTLFTTPIWKKLVAAEDFFFLNGQKLVDETAQKIDDLVAKGQMDDTKYNFLAYLLSRKELSYKDISIITLSLFGDGLNTTVPAIIFALYCLAKNPNAQQSAYEEVCRVIPEGETITPDMVARLPYLKACVKESSRLYPIGLDIKRIPQKNLVIGGYQVPAGTIVELVPYVMFQSAEHFSDPEKFKPERWLRDGSALNIHPYLLTPFGHGPRMCAGRRFAEQEMYVLLSKLLQRFTVDWQGDDLEQKFQMLMVPDKPVTVSFKDRH